jgi:glycosyltransferase involved in cell wall biosynthesis
MSQGTRQTISVLIPAYNAADTIRATVGSVLAQTHPADEILVMDDGSTDNTRAILDTYGLRLKVSSQENVGLGESRNRLYRQAVGDLIAFVDSDDIWHPSYLEVQSRLAAENPEAVGMFVGHFDFHSDDEVKWTDPTALESTVTRVFSSREFLNEYNRSPGNYYPSFCCLRRSALTQLGDQPFQFRISEDYYFFNRLLRIGATVFHSATLGAYRRRPGSLSSKRLQLAETTISALETLQSEYRNTTLENDFEQLFALKRRSYAKILLHFNETCEARKQLKAAMRADIQIAHKLRGLVILGSSYLPAKLRPDWLAKYPEWKSR